MRRVSAIFLAGLLAALMCTQALAAGRAELVRTFVTGNTLYTYVEMEGVEEPITQAEAKVGGQSFPASGQLETVRQAGFPVTYLLLVDNSTSMPGYRDILVSFARQLAESGGEHTTYLLATFGDAFSLLGEDLTAGELEEAMAGIPFDEEVTRLYSCIDQALDYFEGVPRKGNELRCMVILSDAVAYDPGGTVTYEQVLERLGGSDVMLHSVGVGQAEEALSAMGELAAASGGTHRTAADQPEGEQAAQALGEVNGAMLVTGFDLTGCAASGEGQAVSVTFASNGTLVCRGESSVNLPAFTAEEPAPGEPGQLPPSSSPSSGASPSAPEEPDGQEGEPFPVLPAAAAGAAVLAFIAAAVLLRGRRKKGPAAAEQPQGVYMRVEADGDSLKDREAERCLVRELTVGRDPACDIVIDDPSVSRRHARVFLADGRVYLEDLGSQNGTMVNGSPIHMPCALRSGDALTTGEVVWRLKF